MDRDGVLEVGESSDNRHEWVEKLDCTLECRACQTMFDNVVARTESRGERRRTLRITRYPSSRPSGAVLRPARWAGCHSTEGDARPRLRARSHPNRFVLVWRTSESSSWLFVVVVLSKNCTVWRAFCANSATPGRTCSTYYCF